VEKNEEYADEDACVIAGMANKPVVLTEDLPFQIADLGCSKAGAAGCRLGWG